MTAIDTSEPSGGSVASKGLKAGALGLTATIVIGVASTAPGYSLAASVGYVTGEVGLQAPAIMLVAFIPMAFIAASYFYMNRADPDCGTTFTWATRAMGPRTGWLGGWGIIMADLVIMPNLAGITAQYSFLLFGLACVGLPGTIDFISEDLTLHGSIAHHPLLLIGFLSGVSLLGYAVLFLAFRIFLGPRPRSLASIRVPDALPREKLVLIAIAVLLLGGGLMPQTVARQLTQQAAPHAGVPAHEAPHHGG